MWILTPMQENREVTENIGIAVIVLYASVYLFSVLYSVLLTSVQFSSFYIFFILLSVFLLYLYTCRLCQATNSLFLYTMTFHELFRDRKAPPKVEELTLEGKPASTLIRVLERFSSMSGIVTSSHFKKDPEAKTRVLASEIQAKMNKMVKFHRRLEAQQADTAQSLNNWAADLPHLNSRQMIQEFASILLTQRAGSITLSEKLERLKDSFSLVNDRERKLNDLAAARTKLLKNVKDSETKYGVNASCTTLLKEKLEEVQCNLEVVEIQCIRSLSHELKDTFAEYLIAIQNYHARLSDASEAYYACLISFQKDDRLIDQSANNSDVTRILADESSKARSSPACSQCFRELGITTGCAHDSSRNMYPGDSQSNLNHNPQQFAPLPIQMSNDAAYDFLEHDPWQ